MIVATSRTPAIPASSTTITVDASISRRSTM
jgi:hypothetical protein